VICTSITSKQIARRPIHGVWELVFLLWGIRTNGKASTPQRIKPGSGCIKSYT
jgi:hypothetical protein